MRRPVLSLFIGLALLLVGAGALAHPGTDDRITLVNKQIAARPKDARLYLRRAHLHREDAHYSQALRDCARAEKLDPTLPEIAFVRGRVLVLTKRWKLAAESLTHYLASNPNDAEAYLLRGRALRAQKKVDEAAADLRHALSLRATASPEHVIELADALVDAKRLPDARKTVDEALAKLGPVVALVEKAITLDLAANDAAKARLRFQALPPKLTQSPRWQSIRSRIR